MEIQHLVLAPGVQPEVRTSPLTYDTIVATVGYPVEVINIEGGKAVMYACEEGKQKNMPRNEAATKIADGALRTGDYVSGTALVVGPIGPGGVDTSLPTETLSDLLGLAE
jgi:hypothetical protein